jgi:hypothetical protein
VPAENSAELQNGESADIDGQNETPEENQEKTNNTIAGNNKLATDDFSMDLPAGWKGVPNTMAGVAAMAANLNEVINDPAAQKINFKSYLSVSTEPIAGLTMQEYMQAIKAEIQKSVPGAAFANENDLTINEQPARAIEINMAQQGADFKILMVAIQGNKDDVWVLSYNTVKSSWDGYLESFAASAKSFVLKK